MSLMLADERIDEAGSQRRADMRHPSAASTPGVPRVAMADLHALVADLGYRDVCILLHSGKVVFTIP